MFRTDIYGAVPGLTTAAETYESAIRWGQYGVGIITSGLISASTIDSGNTPTFELRIGLLLGQQTSTGQWINYSPTASDGSEVAAGVLITSLRMQDFQGVNQQRFYGILVGGPVQASKLIGLDLMARQQMDKFQFDDNFVGNHWYEWKRIVTKTTSYQALATDNFTLFDNTGATGAVTITLPPIANGYTIGIHLTADQSMTLASFEGANMVALNNASANSVAFSTGSQRIGGAVFAYTNPAGTKWYVENISAGTNTVTVA